MRKFQYRLQKVLDFRQRKEDKLKSELAAAIRTRDAEVAALSALSEKRGKAQKALEGHLRNGDIAEIQFANQFIENLARKIDTQNAIVAKANQEVEVIRNQLTVAAKERKIMEKHKEKKHEEWKEEEKRLEAKWMDEMATTIYHSKQRQLEDVKMEDARYLERMEKIQLMKALKARKK